MCSDDFALLYKMRVTNGKSQKIECIHAVPIKRARGIIYVNEYQVIVYSKLSVVVCNYNARKQEFIKNKKNLILSVDFKIQFQSSIQQISASKNILAIIYGKRR